MARTAPGMFTDHEESISLRDIARIGFRHTWLATSIFLLVVGATLAVVLLLPNTYASEGKLFLRIGRSSVSLDPTATVGQVVSLTETREREINSSLEILQSHELLEAVLGVATTRVVLRRPRVLPLFPLSKTCRLHAGLGHGSGQAVPHDCLFGPFRDLDDGAILLDGIPIGPVEEHKAFALWHCLC